MASQDRKILWADDEIDLLKPHIMLLESKGYRVTSVSNGTDAVTCATREKFDVVLLDESMPGLGGLATLEAIKEHDPLVPIVLVTKNEAESLMDEAIGKRIDDYLIKPVRPTQIFLALKRLLEADRLQDGQRARDYVAELSRLRAESTGGLDWRGWVDLYARSAQWDVELDKVEDDGLKQAQPRWRTVRRSRRTFWSVGSRRTSGKSAASISSWWTACGSTSGSPSSRCCASSST